LKSQDTALLKMVMENFKAFTVYRSKGEQVPILSYKKSPKDEHVTFLYFKQTLRLVDDPISIKDIITGEVLGSAN